MLTQERLVEIHVLHGQGNSIRAIAKQLGVSRNTVRRYLRDLTVVASYPGRAARPAKLEPYKTYLLARIEAAKPHWIPATVLFSEIQDRGYAGGITQLKTYVAEFKTAVPEPVVRFETPPGKQMQVDFTTISRHRRTIKAFVATLGYSRATYVRFSEHERQDDWLRGIEEACHYFGGVPQELLFDNAKTIMIERDAYGEGQHRWNAQLLATARDYGFIARACRPYRARTKGKVERFNGYLKNSFITPLAATLNQAGLRLDVATANAHIGPWLERVAHQRIHGTTGIKPQILLDQERFQLRPLPRQAKRGPEQMPVTARPVPRESFQHPLSTYDRLLEARP
ncbi:IS21 family transposase [Pseudomonas sp. OIL-1]|uniref:IS21 family transposase n=1 Tax=Pseudomonas sp. OIL-1 TaxID=2706126 RepID=UPI0013A7AB95|nr:IS21 family transposase [Pseudomonas sp. OIL-1]QIB50551.1 IS21 family transposase [Pseudomonas sp. OIL-1]